MKNNLLLFGSLISTAAIVLPAFAENIEKNTARMQAMDKITGRVNVIDIPVNGKVDFGSFSVVVRSCQTRSAEEIPDNFAFVDVTDKDLSGKESNIFKGWMISSSPATNAVEHPIYDVWLLQCLDTKVDKALLLSEDELQKRDELPAAKTSEKHKEVADSIDEMQYQNNVAVKEDSDSEDGEDQTLEFEMDEEAADEEETGESEDENTESEEKEDTL